MRFQKFFAVAASVLAFSAISAFAQEAGSEQGGGTPQPVEKVFSAPVGGTVDVWYSGEDNPSGVGTVPGGTLWIVGKYKGHILVNNKLTILCEHNESLVCARINF